MSVETSATTHASAAAAAATGVGAPPDPAHAPGRDDPRSGPAGASLPARRAPFGPPWIAMYHSVGSCAEDPYRITVTPDRLAQQLRWLERNRLRGVGVGELLAARAAGRGRGLVGLSFDDGYTDFVTHALPLLCRARFRATVFVLPGRLGGENEWDPLGPRKPLLTADGIREAHAAGMEIASHGLTHVELTGCDEQLLRAETVGSRTLLAELIRADVHGFCYPYGSVDERVAAAVRRAGYRYACAIDPGRLSGPYALPRLHIGQQDTPLRMALKRRLHPLRRRAPRDEAARV